MANFLDSSVLPGDTIPKHHHRKLLVILSILVLLALGALAYMLYGPGFKKQDISNYKPQNTTDPIVEKLRKDAVQMTDAQKLQSAKLLQNSAQPLTNEEKLKAAELLKQLSK